MCHIRRDVKLCLCFLHRNFYLPIVGNDNRGVKPLSRIWKPSLLTPASSVLPLDQGFPIWETRSVGHILGCVRNHSTESQGQLSWHRLCTIDISYWKLSRRPFLVTNLTSYNPAFPEADWWQNLLSQGSYFSTLHWTRLLAWNVFLFKLEKKLLDLVSHLSILPTPWTLVSLVPAPTLSGKGQCAQVALPAWCLLHLEWRCSRKQVTRGCSESHMCQGALGATQLAYHPLWLPSYTVHFLDFWEATQHIRPFENGKFKTHQSFVISQLGHLILC